MKTEALKDNRTLFNTLQGVEVCSSLSQNLRYAHIGESSECKVVRIVGVVGQRPSCAVLMTIGGNISSK